MAREVAWTNPSWEDRVAVPEFRDASIRELLVRPYRLVYRLHAQQVTILALIHGARRAWRV
jgi:plasmid stabilization system protein ParE